MSGYHETYVIIREGQKAIFSDARGQLEIFDSMATAAKRLTELTEVYPTLDFTIRPLKIKLPWAK